MTKLDHDNISMLFMIRLSKKSFYDILIELDIIMRKDGDRKVSLYPVECRSIEEYV
jgi:hypothetical protein